MLPFHPIENPIISLEKDHRETTRTISIQNIGSSGTSTGITNSVRKNETINDQTSAMVESTAPSTTKILAGKREGEDKTGISFAESQFYARTSNTPSIKRQGEKANEISSSSLIDNLPIKNKEEEIPQNQDLFLHESIDS